MIVNIYTQTTAKPPIKKKTGYAYVLETQGKSGPVTLTNQGVLKDTAKNLAELAAVVKALRHLRKPSELKIYTSPYMASVLNGWLKEWESRGWKNKSGKAVPEEYKELAELLKPHKYEALSESNSYTGWLERTAKEQEEKDE